MIGVAAAAAISEENGSTLEEIETFERMWNGVAPEDDEAVGVSWVSEEPHADTHPTSLSRPHDRMNSAAPLNRNEPLTHDSHGLGLSEFES